ESWIWDAACSIRGAKDAPKYKDYILPLIFTKRLCDVFDDELNRIAAEVGSRRKAFELARADHKLVRFYLPLVPDDFEQPVWSVIRMLSSKIGESLTSYMRGIARENPLLQGIIDRVDFNATTHGQRDLDDDRLSNLIEAVSTKRLGLDDEEADIIGKSYEYLIRKFAEGGGQSAGEFYTPPEVGAIMSRVLQPEPGMEIYDPTCGSGGLLVKCEIAMEEKRRVPLHPHRRGRNLPAHRRNSRGAERHRRGSQNNRQCPAGNSQAVGGGGMKIALLPKKHRNFAP
ncbi:MAG TPA: type I restriction-modification system subunit M N-terminal domain-containing protein, partial [Chlorobaculum sp.]|nr:type I restriction-modification system subunit M N-terminal domain-containing protein [Chlorobaculum sp.]